jgi:hypothetical protein
VTRRRGAGRAAAFSYEPDSFPSPPPETPAAPPLLLARAAPPSPLRPWRPAGWQLRTRECAPAERCGDRASPNAGWRALRFVLRIAELLSRAPTGCLRRAAGRRCPPPQPTHRAPPPPPTPAAPPAQRGCAPGPPPAGLGAAQLTPPRPPLLTPDARTRPQHPRRDPSRSCARASARAFCAAPGWALRPACTRRPGPPPLALDSTAHCQPPKPARPAQAAARRHDACSRSLPAPAAAGRLRCPLPTAPAFFDCPRRGHPALSVAPRGAAAPRGRPAARRAPPTPPPSPRRAARPPSRPSLQAARVPASARPARSPPHLLRARHPPPPGLHAGAPRAARRRSRRGRAVGGRPLPRPASLLLPRRQGQAGWQ